MSSNPDDSETIIIGIGEYRVGTMLMSSIGLGSCVGLVIHDKEKGKGGLAHVMLPISQGKSDRPGKYADTAIKILVSELLKSGCSKPSLIAKIAGGASMFKNFSGNLNIGERNVDEIKRILKEEGIALKGEDVGGSVGRTVTYYPRDKGKLMIRRGDGTILEI